MSLPQASSRESWRPPEARKSDTASSALEPAGAKLGSAKNRRPALLAGGALAGLATTLLIVIGTTGSRSTPPHRDSDGEQQHHPTLTTPNPQPPQPALAVRQAPAAAAPAAKPQQPVQPQPPISPVHFKNPFDRAEIFEFPAGTSHEEARQSVADLLLQRARDRHHPGVAQRRVINGVIPSRPARDSDLAQNSVRGR